MPDAMQPHHESDDGLVQRIAAAARAQGLRVAVAESLTCGNIARLLGRGEAAAEWFSGAVVAYDPGVKFDVLGVTPGPVVSQSCARQMAQGVRDLLRADVALAVTGVGGPGPEEGCAAGTVHLAVVAGAGTRDVHTVLSGDPSELVAATSTLALHELVAACEGSAVE